MYVHLGDPVTSVFTSNTRAAESPPRRWRGAGVRAAAVALMISVGGVAATHQAAHAADATTDEAEFVQRINDLRSSKGLAPLKVNAELARGARSWATEMRAAAGISHMPEARMRADITGPWCKIGENVGEGPEVPILHDAFVASAAHLKNLLDPDFDSVGIGIVYASNSDGEVIYVTQRFLDIDNVCARQDAAAASTRVAGTSTSRTPTELALAAAPKKAPKSAKAPTKTTKKRN